MYRHTGCNGTDYDLTDHMFLVCPCCGNPVADLRTRAEQIRDSAALFALMYQHQNK